MELIAKSELIDSIFRNFPIDSVRAEELTDENGKKTYYIFDGVQRISTVCSFINNKFALSKTLSPVTVDGVTYDIAGKNLRISKRYYRTKSQMKKSVSYSFGI